MELQSSELREQVERIVRSIFEGVIEWSRAGTPLNVLVELAPMQRELGLLRRAWEQDREVVRPLLAFRARAMSDRVLELSGLMEGKEATG
jgi:hypothetical protein